jgi:effector-binding domain-containing protein
MTRTRVLTLLWFFTSSLMAAEQAFPPSPVGAAELKTLPAGVLLKASATGTYFEQSNRLFRPLFNYISKHDIAMTTPVEAQIESAAMYFWVAESQRSKVAGSSENVAVVEVPERHVASLGAKGGYSPENFTKTRDALLEWLKGRKDVEPAGPAYSVYWSPPFLPGFLKRYEVHVPVRPVGK